MSVTSDVIVIGAGAMGAASAWQLARRGLDVVLLEQFEPGHLHGASHGVSRNFNLSYEDPGLLAWLHEADRLWQELESEAEVELLTRTGIINHGPGRDQQRAVQALREAGFEVEVLDAVAATRRWPGFRFDGPVFHTPQAGRLHADHAVAAFTRAATARGTRAVFDAKVVGGTIADDQVTVQVRTADAEQRYTARRLIITAGAWTRDVLDALGLSLALPPLRVTQEQPGFFAPRDDSVQWPGFNHAPSPDDPATSWFPSGVYGMGSPGEGVKAGWHGVGPEIHPDRRTYVPEPGLSQAIQRYAREWLPGVDPEVFSELTCTYTTTPDSVFVLDSAGPVAVGAGFSGHGFKFAPVVGRVLADLVTVSR